MSLNIRKYVFLFCESYTTVHLLFSVSASSSFIATVFVVVLNSAVCSSLGLGVIQDVSVGLDEVLLLFEIHFQHSLNHHEGDATLEEENWVRRCTCSFNSRLCGRHSGLWTLTRMVRCRFDGTLRNRRRPTRLAMEGKMRAPHRVRETERWSPPYPPSAGARGRARPIPVQTNDILHFKNATVNHPFKMLQKNSSHKK